MNLKCPTGIEASIELNKLIDSVNRAASRIKDRKLREEALNRFNKERKELFEYLIDSELIRTPMREDKSLEIPSKIFIPQQVRQYSTFLAYYLISLSPRKINSFLYACENAFVYNYYSFINKGFKVFLEGFPLSFLQFHEGYFKGGAVSRVQKWLRKNLSNMYIVPQHTWIPMKDNYKVKSIISGLKRFVHKDDQVLIKKSLLNEHPKKRIRINLKVNVLGEFFKRCWDHLLFKQSKDFTKHDLTSWIYSRFLIPQETGKEFYTVINRITLQNVLEKRSKECPKRARILIEILPYIDQTE